MRLFRYSLLLVTFFIMSSNNLFAQDDCATAVTVSDLTGVICATSSPSTTDALGAGGCEEGTFDTWFTFTAQGSTANITVTSSVGSWNPEFVVLSTASNLCELIFTSEACFDQNGNYSSIAGSVTTLVPGDTYWVVVSSGVDNTTGTIDVCVDNPAAAANCIDNEDCTNAAVLTLNGPGNGPACITDCNTGASPGIDFVGNGCEDQPNAAVWYEFTVSGATASIDVSVTGTDLSDPEFTIFVGNSCGPWTLLNCTEGTGFSATLTGQNVTLGQTYLISVSDVTGDMGDFDLCITEYPDNSACNTTDSLYVTATSMGSPITGPFIPGEVVTFCYDVTDFQQVNCNYLGAFIPEFGDCWDPVSFDAQGQPANVTVPLAPAGVFDFTGPPQPCEGQPTGSWQWFPAGAATYNNIAGGYYPANSPLPGGWFFMTNYTPGLGCGTTPPTDPDNTYGDSDYPSCGNNTLDWQVCFQLQAQGPIACINGETDCSVTMKTLADAEFGAWTNLGCIADGALTYPATLLCCPLFDPVNDTLVCDSFTLPTITGVLLTGNEAYFTGPGGTGTQYNAGDVLNWADFGAYPVTIYIADPTSCAAEISFQLTIGQTPTVTLTPFSDVCIDAGVQTGLGGGLPTGGVYSGTGVTDDGNGTTFTFDPAAAGAGSITVTYTVTTLPNPPGCTSFATETITVNPQPTISGNAPICIGATVQLTGSGTPNGSTPWTSSNPGVATVDNTGLVTGVSAGTSTITYMDNNGCTNTVVVTVNPTPTISGNAPVCIGSTVQLTGSGTPNGSTPWTSSNPGVATVSVTGLVTGISAGTSTITYMDNAGCSNTVVVTVNPTPTITGNAPICIGATVQLTGSGTPDPTTPWTSSNPGVATVDNTGLVTGVSAGTSTITYMDDNGCTNTVVVTVNPTPTISGNTPICIGSTVQLTGSGTPDPTTPWSSSNPGVATIDNTGLVTGVSAGTSTITYTDNNGCTNTVVVTVNPTPTITGNAPICIGATVQLTGSGTPDPTTPWTSSNPGVATVDNTGLVTGVSAGTSTITYTDNNGCTNTVVVTVNPTPTITGNAPICIGATVQLTGSGTPDPTTPWTSSNPGVATIDNTGLVTGVSAGTSTITYTDDNGCTNTVVVTVNPTPTISGNAPICIGATVQLTGSGTPDPTTPWSSSNPGVATVGTTGLVTGVSAGTSTITYMDNAGCTNTVVVTVNDLPVINTTQTPLTGCNTNDGIISVSDAGGATGTVIWTGPVSGNSGVVTLPFDITLLPPGTYDITFTDNTTGCTSTVSQETLVNPGAPVVDPFTPFVACGGTYQVDYNNITGTLTGNQAFYSASGGNPADIIPDLTVYTAPITITIYAYDENGACSSEEPLSITLNPIPTITGNTPVCIGSTVQLTGSGTPNGSTPWTSSNPGVATVSVTGLVTGVSAGTSTITYMDDNGCTNTEVVTVNPTPTISGNAPICIGATVQLTGSGTPDGTTPWTSSNPAVATVDNTGLVTGVSGGTSTITYMDANGCTNTVVVTVNPTPTITGNAPICIGATVQLTGSGIPDGTTPWTSSNPAVATVDNTGLVTGVSGGTSTITYMDANGCTNTEVVTVNPTPTISGNAPICIGATVQLTGSGTPDGTTPWTSSNPAVATVDNTGLVTGVSGGTSTITYMDANGCTNTEVVTVNPTPTITGNAPICIGATVQLTGSGTPDGTTPWTSSNAAVATVDNTGLVTGVSGGTSTITYMDANGCTNTEVVTVNPTPTITGNAPICIGSTLQLTGSGTPDAFTPWTSSNPGVATISVSGLVTAVSAGTTTITYMDANGCTNTEIVTVNPTPTITGNAPICIGSTVQLTGSGTPDPTTPWSSSNTGVATIDNTGLVTGVSAGTSTITYTDNAGCSITDVVTVNPTPTITGNTPICLGSTLQLTGSGTPDPTTPWSSSNTGVATIDNSGLVTSVTSGTTDITYMDVNGCQVTETVTVNALPTISGTPTVCEGGTTQLTGSGTPDPTTPWTSSNPGVATVDNTGLVSGVTGGTTDITYTDANGCQQTQTVTVNALPVSTPATSTPIICEGNDILLDGNTIAGATYDWSGPNGFTSTQEDPTIPGATTFASGTYTLIITENGCTSAPATVDVSVILSPVLNPISDVTVCDSFPLPAITGTNLTGNENYYNDSQANGGTVLTGPLTTSQTVWVYDGNGTCEDELSFNVTINTTEDPSFTTADFCEGDVNAATVTGTAGGTFAFNPAPADGATIDPNTGSITNGVGGTTYTIEYTTGGSCPASSTQTVTVNTLPVAVASTSTPDICEGLEVLLDGNTIAGATYDWSGPNNFTSTTEDPTIPDATSAASGTYTLIITENGCVSSPATVDVIVEPCELIIPTAFTPGKQPNENWQIEGLDDRYPNNIVTIFNRWGNLLYKHESDPSNPYSLNPWDGTNQENGEPLPVASYYFIIDFNDGSGDGAKGTATIIKN